VGQATDVDLAFLKFGSSLPRTLTPNNEPAVTNERIRSIELARSGPPQPDKIDLSKRSDDKVWRYEDRIKEKILLNTTSMMWWTLPVVDDIDSPHTL
jgi:hypothetical protein